jgi:hypothetical protein
VNPSLCRLTTGASPDANLPTVLCAFQVIARHGGRTPLALGVWAFFTQRVGNSLAPRPAGFQGQPLTTRQTVSPRASSNRFRLIFPVESRSVHVRCRACLRPGVDGTASALRRADQDNSDQGGQQSLRLTCLEEGTFAASDPAAAQAHELDLATDCFQSGPGCRTYPAGRRAKPAPARCCRVSPRLTN